MKGAGCWLAGCLHQAEAGRGEAVWSAVARVRRQNVIRMPSRPTPTATPRPAGAGEPTKIDEVKRISGTSNRITI